MRVNLTSDEWTTVEVPAGTLQNLSPTASIEIVEENESDNNSGIVLYPRQKFAYSDTVTIKARSVWDTNIDSTQDVILAIEPIVSATGGGGGGGGGMTTIAIGSTTTGAPGSNAVVTNSGTALSAILNFTIPRGATGADGRSFTISGLYPTYADMVTDNPNPTEGEAHFVGTADDNVIYFWDTALTPPNWTNAGPLKGLKGDPGENGAAATVNIGSVTIGTPVSVTNSGTANAAVLDIVLPPGTASDWFYLRRNNATYVAGDIAYSLLLPSWLRLECVQGGTTGATEPTYTATPGSYANDGTVIWIVTAVNDGTPVGRVVFDDILRAGYIKANGAAVADASTAIPRLLAFVQANPSLLAADATEYAGNVGKYLYDSGTDALTLPNFIGKFVEGGNTVEEKEAGLPNIKGSVAFHSTEMNDGEIYQCTGAFEGYTELNKVGVYGTLKDGLCYARTNFNASRSSSVYSDSINTVQPPAITLIPQIRY